MSPCREPELWVAWDDKAGSVAVMLIGNSYPLSLIRRRVVIETRTLPDLLSAMHSKPWRSFWGHENTVAVASMIACADLRPATARLALLLSDEKLPMLDGVACRECWILSPDYTPGYRPAAGEVVSPDRIIGWQVLKMTWE